MEISSRLNKLHMLKGVVSIVIPTRDSAEYIENCLVSCQQQTYENIEIIVIDCYSEDKTKEIARKYTDKVFNFNKKGDHRSEQRNFGTERSSGKYVIIIDSDMKLSKNVVNLCVRKIKSDRKLKGVVIPEKSFGCGFWARCKKLEKSFYVGVDWMEAARFFDKKSFLESGGYDIEMTSGEDWDLSQRIEKIGKIDRISDFIYHNEGKISLLKTINRKFYYAGRIAKYANRSKNQEKVRKQMGIISRYKLFLFQPKKLFKNPVLGMGMLFLKTCEFGFGGMGYIFEKLKFKR